VYTAWAALLVMLLQLVSPMTLAGYPAYPDQVHHSMPQAGNASNHHHHCAGTQPRSSVDLPDHHGSFCQHCQGGVCCVGCVPVALNVSAGSMSIHEVLSPHRITLVSSACSAESLYRPPIAL
jgi:hypothetical protein